MSIHKKRFSLNVKTTGLARIAKKTCHPFLKTSLIATFQQMRSSSGVAPGIDGITFDSLSDREWEEKFHSVSRKLFNGSYEPMGVKEIKLKKDDGVSYRKISINTVLDRVISKACLNECVKHHDSDFYEWSYGSRPGKSRNGAFEELERLHPEGFTYYHKLDVKDAFDKLDLHRLYRLVSNLNVDQLVKNTIVKLIKGVLYQDREYGIGQGNPLGGFLFNLFMHHHFDSKLNSLIGSGQRLIRYVDDILIVGTSMDLVHELKNECYKRLSEMRLTWGKELSCDIKNDKFPYLGLTLQTIDNNLVLSLPDDFHYQLDCLIDSCLTHPSPIVQIKRTVRGWMNSINKAKLTLEDKNLINQTIRDYDLELNNQLVLVDKPK